MGVIATEESIKAYPEGIVKCIGTRADEESIARHLFAVLREFDDCGVTYIYSEAFETSAVGAVTGAAITVAAGSALTAATLSAAVTPLSMIAAPAVCFLLFPQV